MKESIDWRNASDYPTDLEPDEWREEFLKRLKPSGVADPPLKDARIYIRSGVELRILLNAGCCLAEINLKRKIDPQLKKIGEAVRSWQKKINKETKAGLIAPPDGILLRKETRLRDPKKLADYLRALDARKSLDEITLKAPTFEEIWRTIYPESKAQNPRSAGSRLVTAAEEMQLHFKYNTLPVNHQLTISPQPSPRCLWGEPAKQPSE